jgi:outer membrane lipoprotein carrier protein
MTLYALDKNKIVEIFLFIILLLAIPMNSIAEDMPAHLKIAKELQSTYEKTLGFSATFKQTTSLALSGRNKEGSGTVVFLKPGYMRWDYLAPDKQVLISDGETITMYFEKANQMILTSAKEYLQSDVTYSFFSGTGNILEDFDVSPAEEPTEKNTGSQILRLVPKASHPHVSSLYVWIAKDQAIINKIRIIDHFDTTTDLVFEDVQLKRTKEDGPVIDEKLFSFTPPAGTEIINQ